MMSPVAFALMCQRPVEPNFSTVVGHMFLRTGGRTISPPAAPAAGSARPRLAHPSSDTMKAVLLIMFWVASFVAVVALVIAHVMREADAREAGGGQHSDEEIHDRGAEGEVEDMLDAIIEHRLRVGRRDIGEQIAEGLLRGTAEGSPRAARRASARRRAPARREAKMLRAGRGRSAARPEDLPTHSATGSGIHPTADQGLGYGPWQGRTFILCHEHRPEECRIAIAAWKGYRIPLRGGRPLGSCASDGRRLWWTVQAADGPAALPQLPGYVADRTAG